ncbi:MAG: hypothetical protein BWY83_03385 [bacterium ADurb.Bin478]|nr:MAG: hypothetical protein BWY83_03385 [bacterium ADurb.Bin478]
MVRIRLGKTAHQARTGRNGHGQRFERVDAIAQIADLIDKNRQRPFAFQGLLVAQLFDEHDLDGAALRQTLQSRQNDLTAFCGPAGGRMADARRAELRRPASGHGLYVKRKKHMLQRGVQKEVIELDRDHGVAQRIDLRNDAARAQIAAGVTADHLFPSCFHAGNESRFTGQVQPPVQLIDIVLIQAIPRDGAIDDRLPQAVAATDEKFFQRRVRHPHRRQPLRHSKAVAHRELFRG